MIKRKIRGPEDYIKIEFSREEQEAIIKHAASSTLYGSSAVRLKRAERILYCGRDQLVGRSNELGLLICCRGREAGFKEFVAMREFRDRPENRGKGDNGKDSLDDPFDIKGRYRDPLHTFPITEYELPVRPNERHEGFTYVLGITPTMADDCLIPYVLLPGWIPENELPPVMTNGKKNTPNGTYPFEGAWTAHQRQLYSMESFPFMRVPLIHPETPEIISDTSQEDLDLRNEATRDREQRFF